MRHSWNKAALLSALMGMTLFALFLMPLSFAGSSVAVAAGGGNLLVNPGFEATGGTSNPPGWSSTGDVATFAQGRCLLLCTSVALNGSMRQKSVAPCSLWGL